MASLPRADEELLQAYSAGDRSALDEMVARYIDLVYSSARRQIKDPHLADDVTQAVFIVLFKRAKSLKPGVVLPAWLHRTTQFCAANARRIDSNRRLHEQEAAAMNTKNTPEQCDALDHAELLSQLDELVNNLPDTERKAIIMRYLQGRENAEVGMALGVSTAAAAKKVQRAVERLRGMLGRSGHQTTAAALAVTLLNAQRFSASTALGRAIGSMAASSHSSHALIIATSAMRDLSRRRFRRITAVGATLIAIATGAILLFTQATPPTRPPIAAAQPATQAATTLPEPSPAWRARFDEVYHLDAGEAVRRVRPPYIPERDGFVEDVFKPTFSLGTVQNTRVDKVATSDDVPVAMYLEFNRDTRRVERWIRWSNDHAWAMESLIVNLVGIDPGNLDLAGPLAGIALPGDWVIRRDSTLEQRLEAMKQITATTPAAFAAEKRRVKRDVIVAHGNYSKADFTDGIVRLSVYEDKHRVRESGEPGWFFRELGHMLGRPIVNEWAKSKGAPIEFNYFTIHTPGITPEDETKKRADILTQLSGQMHIKLTEETREIDTWVITPLYK